MGQQVFKNENFYIDETKSNYIEQLQTMYQKDIVVPEMKYKEFSKFPSIKKDVAFIVDRNLESAIIEKQIKKSAGSLLTNIEVFDVYTGEHVDENKKSIAYSLTFSDSKKTLTDDEVTGIFNKVIADAERVFGAEIRK